MHKKLESRYLLSTYYTFKSVLCFIIFLNLGIRLKKWHIIIILKSQIFYSQSVINGWVKNQITLFLHRLNLCMTRHDKSFTHLGPKSM